MGKIPMRRITEPELMDEAGQAAAYASADFAAPHNHFIQLLRDTVGGHLGATGRAVDLGCGAADISIRFAGAWPGYRIDAIDGAAAMLAEAQKALAQAGLSDRITLIEARLDHACLSRQAYELIFSNSLLHHLHEPMLLWDCIKNARGAPAVFIMDLMRPDNETQVAALVREYAAGEPAILQRDFRASLKAAFTPAEVRAQLRAAGLDSLAVNVVSDRHLTIHGRLSAGN